jgi:predicted Zn finger-like uncharacterized protein
MPSELVSCPECQRKLRVPDGLVGKLVKCPTCGQTFTADPVAQAPPPPPVEQKPTRTSKVGRDKKDDDEDDDRSRRRSRSRRDDDDDDDDRPRRRRSRFSRDDDDDDDDDYDDDDRPRRRRRRRDLAPHRSGTILALGILSFFFFWYILGPMAWVMGNTDLAEMRAGRMDREGESQTNAGRMCGMISVIVHCIILVLVLGICCAGGLGNAGRR